MGKKARVVKKAKQQGLLSRNIRSAKQEKRARSIKQKFKEFKQQIKEKCQVFQYKIYEADFQVNTNRELDKKMFTLFLSSLIKFISNTKQFLKRKRNGGTLGWSEKTV